MNYILKYTQLITSAQLNHNSIIKGYYEKHHIIPKCIGGSDLPSNIVCLTMKQHRLAHILLYKVFKDTYPNLIYAISSCYTITDSRKNGGVKKARVPKWVLRLLVQMKNKNIQKKRLRVKKTKRIAARKVKSIK